MIEAGDLLGSVATLAAVTLAVFAFTLPRSVAIYNKKKTALLEADVPDPVKKQNLFVLFVFGDSYLLFVTGILSLFIGMGFVISLYHAFKLYVGSPVVAINVILENLSFLLFLLFIVLSVLLVASLSLFTTEVIMGEKKLPLLTRVYARDVLGRRSSKMEADSLVPEAENLYKKEAFGEAGIKPGDRVRCGNLEWDW